MTYRRRLAINWHTHQLCGHLCPCTSPIRFVCFECQRTKFNESMAREYAEDKMTTEQLLERRS